MAAGIIDFFGIFVSTIGLVVINAVGYNNSLSSSTGADTTSLISLIIGIIFSLSFVLVFVVMLCVVNGKLVDNKKHKIQIDA